MSYTLTFNGNNYVLPDVNEVGWGNNVNSYFIAIAAGCFQKTGGSFTLSAETDFGAGFGLKSLYYKSRSSNPAGSGIVRLSNNGDAISWRNALNSADLPLIVNASNNLQFNGNDVVDAVGTGLTQTADSVALTVPVVVSSGGTGDTSLTAYAVLCGGTTPTGAIQSIASVGGSGQVLTSNGAGALPTFQNVAGTGTVNSGTAGNLSLYPTSTNAVSDTYTQNSHSIVLSIAAQASRSANLVLTIPNPGNAVTSANVVLDHGATVFLTPTTTFEDDNAKLALERSSNGRTGFIAITDAQGGLEFHGANSGAGEAGTVAFEFTTDSPSAETVILSIPANGQLQAVDGNVNAPTYSFGSDTDLGFYKSNTDEVSFTSNSTQRFRLTATGDIVGTVSAGDLNWPNTQIQVSGNQIYPTVNIIKGSTSTNSTTTSNTFTTTNLTASITPKFNTSKILISMSGTVANANPSSTNAFIALFRGSTQLATTYLAGTGTTAIVAPVSLVDYDSPATTSPITYSVQFRSDNNATLIQFGLGQLATLILTEVAQ